MTFLRYYLFIAPHVLLGLLFLILWRRRFHRQLPAFCAYIIVEELFFLAELIVTLHRPFSRATYSWTVLFGNGLTSILTLVVVYSLAEALVFSRFPSFPRLRSVFTGALATLVLVAGFLSGNLSQVNALLASNILYAIDFSAGLVQAGALLVLLVLGRALQISWRNFMTGIILGFGVSACISLAASALRDHFGHKSIIAVDVVEMTGYHICVVIWLIYVFLPERTLPSGKSPGKPQLESWNEELDKIVRN